MRIIKFIFKSIVFLTLVGGAGFLLTREILLFMGISKIKSSLSNLRSISVQKQYFAKCKEKGSVFISGDDPATMQLRFISSTEYVLEVLCSQFSIDPILIEQEQLPKFVSKVAGGSGIVWGDARSGVALEVFDRQKSVGVEDRLIVDFPVDDELGVGPATSCSGYGFSCCKFESEQGVGQQFAGSMDCPKSCFSSCVSRPIVLAFNTQPPIDLQRRLVIVAPGEAITFSFVVDPGPDNSVSAKLNYGDGQEEVFYGDKQIVNHTYQCSEQECFYKVKLTVENDIGVSAADLPIMSMSVLMREEL